MIDVELAELLHEAGVTDADQDRRLRALIAERNEREGTRWLERAEHDQAAASRPPAR
jgi:hypothetical protein